MSEPQEVSEVVNGLHPTKSFNPSEIALFRRCEF
jgi:hypothetical protein